MKVCKFALKPKPDPNQMYLFVRSGFSLAPVSVRTHFTFFQTRSCFLAEQGCNQLRDLQVSSSSAILHLLCSVSIIFSHKEEPKENKIKFKKRERENPIEGICCLGQAWQAQKVNIHCHQFAPGRGEGTQCYNTLIIYPQIFSGTCNPHPASQEHVCRVQAMRKSGREEEEIP